MTYVRFCSTLFEKLGGPGGLRRAGLARSGTHAILVGLLGARSECVEVHWRSRSEGDFWWDWGLVRGGRSPVFDAEMGTPIAWFSIRMGLGTFADHFLVSSSLNTFPPFITNPTLSRIFTSLRGSSETAMRSA